MAGEVLVDEPADGVVRLTISHPEKRNALDQPILDRLAELLGTLDARCVVITGTEGMFSSGYDIGDLSTDFVGGASSDVFAVEAEKLVAHPYSVAIQALEAYPYATVAALSGHTIGGGLEIALSCDMRVAHDGILLGMPPAKLGLVYSHTGLRKFLDAIGEPHTRELFLLGRNVDAATALRWGLVNRVVPESQLEDVTLELAEELAANAPLSVSGNKRVLRELLRSGGALDADVERELIALRQACFASDDLREGVRAFAEKRPARWRGR
jgi:enoyl-CoA hydratase/carnithine racemase